jgi:ATP-dependent DNA helicase RecQ
VLWERTGGGLRLADARAPLAAFQIDWELLDRRRRADLAKLDAVQRYAYTTGCRRGFVLRYFGDPAARPRCEGCDNCLGTHVALQAATPAPAGTSRSRTRSKVGRVDELPTQRFANGAKDPAVTRAGAPAAGEDLDLSADDASLLADLKALRGVIAREAKVPAYVIFPDRTLLEFAVRRPRSLDALREVRGVGPVKLEKYGHRFLSLIRGTNGTEAA